VSKVSAWANLDASAKKKAAGYSSLPKLSRHAIVFHTIDEHAHSLLVDFEGEDAKERQLEWLLKTEQQQPQVRAALLACTHLFLATTVQYQLHAKFKAGAFNVCVAVQLLDTYWRNPVAMAAVIHRLTQYMTVESETQRRFESKILEVEFYLPQLMHQLTHMEFKHPCKMLQTFLFDLCANPYKRAKAGEHLGMGIHLALQIYWALEGAREDASHATPASGDPSPEQKPMRRFSSFPGGGGEEVEHIGQPGYTPDILFLMLSLEKSVTCQKFDSNKHSVEELLEQVPGLKSHIFGDAFDVDNYHNAYVPLYEGIPKVVGATTAAASTDPMITAFPNISTDNRLHHAVFEMEGTLGFSLQKRVGEPFAIILKVNERITTLEEGDIVVGINGEVMSCRSTVDELITQAGPRPLTLHYYTPFHRSVKGEGTISSEHIFLNQALTGDIVIHDHFAEGGPTPAVGMTPSDSKKAPSEFCSSSDASEVNEGHDCAPSTFDAVTPVKRASKRRSTVQSYDISAKQVEMLRSWEAEQRLQRFKYFSDQKRFVKMLTDTSESLRLLPREDRKINLARLLGEMELPEGKVYIPLCKATDPFKFILRLMAEEAVPFSTHERCPYLVCFEVAEGENTMDVPSSSALLPAPHPFDSAPERPEAPFDIEPLPPLGRQGSSYDAEVVVDDSHSTLVANMVSEAIRGSSLSSPPTSPMSARLSTDTASSAVGVEALSAHEGATPFSTPPLGPLHFAEFPDVSKLDLNADETKLAEEFARVSTLYAKGNTSRFGSDLDHTD
jgi:hypothetical protein